MIRWYDYVAAILTADVILTLFLTGANNESNLWWVPVVFGLLSGLTYRLWVDVYCNFRLKQEQKNV